MDRRLTVLEARFDTILPTLATKADIDAVRLDMQKLRVELTQALNDQVKWMIGIMVTLFIATLGVNITLYSDLKTIILSKQPVATNFEQRTPPLLAPAAR